jgi:spore germination protein KC
LDEKEAWMLMQIKEKKIGGDLTVNCPERKDEYMTAHPKKLHVKSKVEPFENTFKMTINVLVEMDIVESMCGTNYAKEKNYKLMEKEIADEMNDRAAKLVEKVQKEYGVDLFGMGNKVRAKYLRQFEKSKWDQEFPKTKINIQYAVKVRRVGMKMQ